MCAAVPKPASMSTRIVVGAILGLGGLTAVLLFRAARETERQAAEAEFRNRTATRIALAREILGRHEDTLMGLATLLLVKDDVTPGEFVRAARKLDGLMTGALAYEWVPQITHAERAETEARLSRYYPGLASGIIDYPAPGQPRRAPERATYLPIVYVHPLAGNEPAVGFDLAQGPTRGFLTKARETGKPVVTAQVKLVQGAAEKLGVILIVPAFRAVRDAAGAVAALANPAQDTFAGVVQCVFDVHDLLDLVHTRQPDSILDLLFLDASESDPARRVLYYRSAESTGETARMTEAAFRSRLNSEARLDFGGRDWRIVFRPKAGWIESRFTLGPAIRAASVLGLTGLLAGLVAMIGRRTRTIEAEVAARTAELAESRGRLDAILAALPGMAYRGHYVKDFEITFVSDGAYGLTGYQPDDFLSGRVHLRDIVVPEDLERARQETRASVALGRPIEVEYRIRTRDGAEKWVLSRGRSSHRTAEGVAVFDGLAIDITARKNAEAARLALERKLLDGQKLESLGLLAGGIAHDFNNLLSAILGNAGLARLALPAAPAVEAHLGAIETASMRAAELCRQMLAYAGKGRFVVEPTGLSGLVEELMPLLKVTIAHQATLRLELAPGLPPVSADATQLRQIVMNLVLNAADASAAGGGEIVVRTGETRVEKTELAECAAGADLPEGTYVFLEVEDHGVGMTPEVRAKIFDPFFTTKFAGRGLGLAAVLGIVRGHGGALRVRSKPGEGSTFRLLLPPQAGAVALPSAAVPPESPLASLAGSVLVAEDEENVRTVVGAMLRVLGLKVELVPDGETALATFAADPARFDLVMLDLLMPGLTGEQTLERMRAIRPDLRALLMSGYSEGDILGRVGGDATQTVFLPKPFTREALERGLRDLLGGLRRERTDGTPLRAG